MKLLLTSAGFTNEEIFQACEKLVGKKRHNIKVVAIEEAHKVEPGPYPWLDEEKQILLDNFKTVTTLPLQSASPSEMKKLVSHADLIYCFGGNTTYLTKVLEDTGFAKLLPKLLEQKVWVGSSAGSCVLGHKESDAMSRDVYQEKPYTDHYLNILPMVILPHFHGDFDFTKADVKREAKTANYSVYALSDQAALKITGRPGNLVISPIGSGYHIDLGKDLDETISKALKTTTKALDQVSDTLKNLFN